MLAAATCLVALASTLVAFDGWPVSKLASDVGSIVVQDHTPVAAAPTSSTVRSGAGSPQTGAGAAAGSHRGAVHAPAGAGAPVTARGAKTASSAVTAKSTVTTGAAPAGSTSASSGGG